MTGRLGKDAGVVWAKRDPAGPGATNNKSSAPLIKPPIGRHERFTTWRYTFAGVTSTLVMVSSEPITRAEALKGRAQHYGYRNLLSLNGGQHAR